MFSLLTVLALPLLSSAVVYPRHNHDHLHESARQLPGAWFHHESHPVHALFRRNATDGVTYAPVGSDEWAKPYPDGPPTKLDPTKMPSAWLDALNAAVARGAIPKIPVATQTGDDNPKYPSGYDPNGPEVCSGTEQCRIPGDIWDAPDGHLGISFDDGPQPASDGLSAYLASQKQPVTHFMIGSNILWYPSQFLKAFEAGDDIAVHTWTHPYMTTQSNELVVAELGWTVQMIHNSTGGRVPRFWRPPYGDTDTRVSAIAKEVFGLTTVVWNQDTNDWSLTDSPPGTTPAAINASMHTWLTGSKSPGLIILEHELSNDSVDAFKAAYPLMTSTGWTVQSLATLLGNGTVYQNAASDTSAVTRVDNIIDAVNVTVPSSASASSASGTSSAGGSSSGSGGSGSGSGSSPAASPSASGTSGARPVGASSAVGLATAALFGILICA